MRMRYVEIAVGIFMVIGLLALVVMAFRVSGLSVQPLSNSYTLKARFENLGGLNERAKVSMAGVTVGRVTNIYLDTERYAAVVEMEISSAAGELSRDTSAAIMTSGLLGEKFIALTVGADEEILGDNDWIEETQSALILEDLIGRFLFNKAAEE